MKTHPSIKSIKFTVIPTDAPLLIFDPIRECDIGAAATPRGLCLTFLDAGSFTPRFVTRHCVSFSPRAVWYRYVLAVHSRADRKFREVDGGFNMKEWLQSLT